MRNGVVVTKVVASIVASSFLLATTITLLGQSFSGGNLADEMNLIVQSLRQQQIGMTTIDTTSGGSNSNSSSRQTDFNLAYEQSFGLFTDIPNTYWKRMQEIHAKAFPNHFEKTLLRHSHTLDQRPALSKSLEVAKAVKSWYAQNFQEEFHCAAAQRIPSDSNGDGPKWVCDPHRLANKPDCLVYSVGSNGNVMFEKGIRDEIGPHCEIHTFDLVRYNKRNGDFAEALKGIATFHHWGFGTQEQADQYRKTKRGPAFKTVQQTMQELGHTNRTIDIFKIDCEACEWVTFHDWLTSDIRQILVETHAAPHARGS